MKNRILIICLVILSSISCKEVDKLTEFNMDFNTQVTFPATPVSNIPVSISSPSIPTNSSTVFSNRETRQDLIEEITLSKMDLNVIAPAGNNLDFFQSIEVFMSASDLPEVSIASKMNIPDGLSILVLEPSGANIKDYIKKADFSLRFAITTDEVTTQDHDLGIEMTYFVDAKLLGS